MNRDFVTLWRRLLIGIPQAPSIPFVIGALRTVRAFAEDGDGLDQMQVLFQSMADHWVDENTMNINYIRNCTHFSIPVFAFGDVPYLHSTICFPGGGRNEARLGFSRSIAEPGRSLSNIVEDLYNDYEHSRSLSEGLYSIDETTKKWRPFDAPDLAKIAKAVN